MRVAVMLAVFSSLCLLLTVHGHSVGRTISLTQTPCTPRYSRTCGNHELLSEVSTPMTDSDRPNVCKVTKTYQVMTFAYVVANVCFGGRCSLSYCARTRNCTGPPRNVTTIKTACCDGFAVDPEAAAAKNPRRSFYSKSRAFREIGCTLMLRESVIECLLELGLDAFTLELLSETPDTANQLGNGNADASFIVFGINNTNVNASVNTLGHVVNETVEGTRLVHGRVLQTLAANVSLHIGKARQRVFANGEEIVQLNACQARNGIVHIVNAAIPLPSMTIADTLRQDPRFSTFLQLLDGAKITPFLDVAKGKSRTLLAPTNAAFDKLPNGTAACLLRDENSNSLSQLVLIHISSPAEYNVTLSQRSRLITFNRSYYLFVRVEDGSTLLTNNRIPLEESDIPANNGVIHAIPEVIVPPEVDFDKLCPETDEGPGVGVVGA